MDEPKLRHLEPIVFGTALVLLILDAGGGPGWGASSGHTVLAARMEHLGAAPLYDLLAGAAALAPVGEPAFRLGVLGALLGACTLAGVIAATRALLPSEPVAGIAGVLLLAIASPFREACAFASPAALAACGATWSIAFALRYARGRDTREAVSAFAACALVIGSAPWLGSGLAVAIVVVVARAGLRRTKLAIAVGVLGLVIALWWFGARGGWPGAYGSFAMTLAATGKGAAAILVGAGLLGVGFGAATGLRFAASLAIAVVIAGAHDAIVGGSPAVVLAILAIASAIVPTAIVRAAAPKTTGMVRHAIALAASVPLVAAALLAGGTFAVDDPSSTPRQLATDLIARLPPGPGVFVATRPTTWLAIDHEIQIAGARPDLALVPPMPALEADAIVANALRAEHVVGSDAASFGRLDVRRAIPSGRGFQLLGAVPEHASPVEPPAHYRTTIGAEQATLLALERARVEAASGRLDMAARAAGLAEPLGTFPKWVSRASPQSGPSARSARERAEGSLAQRERFGAADLAVLAATTPTRERPALFGFVPIDLTSVDERPGPWLLDLFGDDLAWVAGIEQPPLPMSAPMPRRLHAAWRAILLGKTTPEDPAIEAMGPRAVAATRALWKKN